MKKYDESGASNDEQKHMNKLKKLIFLFSALFLVSCESMTITSELMSLDAVSGGATYARVDLGSTWANRDFFSEEDTFFISRAEINAHSYAEAVQQGREMPADLAKLEITDEMAGIIWGMLDSMRNLRRVEQLAEKHPNASFLLGYAYEHGLIVKQDWSKAASWYSKARAGEYKIDEKHYAECAYQAALVCEKGSRERFSWYEVSAALGHKEAQCALGICLMEGRGAPQPDPESAVQWFKESAGQGCKDAQFMLGRAYWEGRGVLRNYPKAVELFTQAKAQGDVDSLYYLGRAHEHGIVVPRNVEEARKLYMMAAVEGHADACCALGNMYYNGSLGEANPVEAVAWYGKAANKGNVEAVLRLANIYERGFRGIPPNTRLAKRYRARAKKLNSKKNKP